jgi:hypothetical protein
MAEKKTIKLDIKFNQPITAVSLCMGGWLPVAFTRTPHVLVDRNVVGILRQIGYTTDRSDLKANKWWFDFLDSACYTLNPILCAMEGDAKGTPSFDKFVNEFDSVAKLLKDKLPNAKVVKYQKESYEGAYQIVKNLLDRSTRETKFLINIAPIVAERPSDRIIRNIEDKIFLDAQQNNLSNLSLVILAVLSCLYDHKNGSTLSIGKRVVKPKKDYNEKRAYNVISDLRCLEALIVMNALTNNAVSFITRDKGLIAFWCAINPQQHKYVGNSTSYDVDINTKLFPRLDEEEIIRLTKRLRTNYL